MVNINLTYSSIFCGIVLLYFCCEYYSNDNILLIWLTLIGIFTSILNHSYKNNLLQCIDRITMVIGFFIILYISNKRNTKIISLGIILTVFLYLLSKCENDNLYHLYAHLLITVNIILLLRTKIYLSNPKINI
jgi:hypothetical protein